jgi:DNA replication protein DnaC
MSLLGGAGTGKSSVVKALLNKYQSRIMICSYMAQSSNLVGGITLHSLLSLPINAFGHKDLSEDKIEEIREKFKGVDLLIIDEFYTVGQNLLYWINRRL